MKQKKLLLIWKSCLSSNTPEGVLASKHCSNWSLFFLNGFLEFSSKNMTYSELKEIAKKRIFDSVMFIKYKFTDSDGIPIPIEEIFPLFYYAKKLYLFVFLILFLTRNSILVTTMNFPALLTLPKSFP